MSSLTTKALEFKKWIELLQERTMTQCNLAITSVFKATNDFYYKATYRKEKSTLIGKKIEKDDTSEHKKAKDRLGSPLGSTQDSN